MVILALAFISAMLFVGASLAFLKRRAARLEGGWQAFVPDIWGRTMKHEIILAPTLDALYESIQSYMKTHGGVFEYWELVIDADC